MVPLYKKNILPDGGVGDGVFKGDSVLITPKTGLNAP